ncbi:cytochrome c oxidase subunit II [soil metagenome]|nr:cytochrome c oxidase subunit II [Euzebyaceae bacterium]
MRAGRPRRSGMRTWVPVVLGGLLLGACETAALGGDTGELPMNALDPAGPIARLQDNLWNVVFPIAVFVFVLVQGLILFAVFRFRDRGDGTPPRQVAGNTRLEVLWTIIPALILAGIAVPTVRTIFELADPPAEDALIVEVVGKQYWWEFTYRTEQDPADDVVTANELHIPTGREVYIELNGRDPESGVDVIHSFWIPRLAGKADYVPGHTRTMRIAADEPGTYPGQCAEFCGLSHANMKMVVVAHDPAEFDEWFAHQAEPADAEVDGQIAEGAEIVGQQCVGCHAVDGLETSAGVQIAPNLTHFALRERFAGYILDTTADNLHAWITDPQDLKPGAQMPAFGESLTSEQIDAVVAYLQTLE